MVNLCGTIEVLNYQNGRTGMSWDISGKNSWYNMVQPLTMGRCPRSDSLSYSWWCYQPTNIAGGTLCVCWARSDGEGLGESWFGELGWSWNEWMWLRTPSEHPSRSFGRSITVDLSLLRPVMSHGWFVNYHTLT